MRNIEQIDAAIDIIDSALIRLTNLVVDLAFKVDRLEKQVRSLSCDDGK